MEDEEIERKLQKYPEWPEIGEPFNLTSEEVETLYKRAMKELRMEWTISDGKHEQRMWRKFWIGCMK